jgi:hypothetical protein
MQKNFRLASLLSALILATAATAHADDTAYEIKMHRPCKVGDKFDMTDKAETQNKAVMTVDGNAAGEPREEKTAVELQATLEITAVDDIGRETGLHLVVKKLTLADGDAAAADVLPAGAEIDVAYKEKTVEFTQKNGELSEDAKKALSQIYRPRQSKKTDDDMFGTKNKQKPGASWKPDFKAMAEDFTGSPMELNPEKMTGTVKLAAVKTTGQTPTMELQATIEATDVTIKELGKSKEAKIKGDFASQIPIDTSRPDGASQMSMSVHIVVDVSEKTGQPNSTLTIDGLTKHHGARVKIK